MYFMSFLSQYSFPLSIALCFKRDGIATKWVKKVEKMTCCPVFLWKY